MKNNHESNNIIFYPNFEKLKSEVEKFRVELSMLVLKKDELLSFECKNIEMQYMLSIGGLEYYFGCLSLTPDHSLEDEVGMIGMSGIQSFKEKNSLGNVPGTGSLRLQGK